jgi:hypothetical protein
MLAMAPAADAIANRRFAASTTNVQNSVNTTFRRQEQIMRITYTTDANGILYPDLAAPMGTEPDIGTWGRRRKRYLKEHRPAMYAIMKSEGTLFQHLADINVQAERRFSVMVDRLAVAQSVDNTMKHRDQMGWVGAINNIRHSVEEVINSELIYC